VEDKTLQTYDPTVASPLTFEEIDHRAFPLFGLGVEAGRRGGCAPAVYNAGNEIAVQAFLEEQVSFPAMADVVMAALEGVGVHDVHGLEDVSAADGAARELASEAVRRASETATRTTA
jgi:1-deoxy-D-xylulose-5-phosphate reductoisomerase